MQKSLNHFYRYNNNSALLENIFLHLCPSYPLNHPKTHNAISTGIQMNGNSKLTCRLEELFMQVVPFWVELYGYLVKRVKEWENVQTICLHLQISQIDAK